MLTLTILTPTGARPEAFALCQRMLARQTWEGPVHWIVIDDGEEPAAVTLAREGWRITVLRPEPRWTIGQNTQGRNLLAGLEEAGDADLLTVWEDDDWYARDWLATLATLAPEAELIGEGWARWYNVASRRFRELGNTDHASLRSTAMRGAALQTFRDVLAQPDRYYDLQLWRQHADCSVFCGFQTVGIKGMPGRPGIAEGHLRHEGVADPHLEQLRRWIGDDADLYAPFSKDHGLMTDRLTCRKAFTYVGRAYRPGDAFVPVREADTDVLVTAGLVARIATMPVTRAKEDGMVTADKAAKPRRRSRGAAA